MKYQPMWKQFVARAILVAVGVQSVAGFARADGPAPRPGMTLDQVEPRSAQKVREVIRSQLLQQQGQEAARTAENESGQMIEIGTDPSKLKLPVMDAALIAPDRDDRNPEFETVTTLNAEMEKAKSSGSSASASNGGGGSASAPRRNAPLPTAAPEQPEGLHRKLWFVTAELLGLQVGAVALMSALPNSVTHWGKPDPMNILRNFTSPPHFDNDAWQWNYIAHPISGSEYYLLARNRNATWWQSLLYSAAMSLFWESVTEGIYEKWSYQDLLITPIAGAVLGELRYQAKRALIDPKTGRADKTWKKILVVIVDPMDALTGGRF